MSSESADKFRQQGYDLIMQGKAEDAVPLLKQAARLNPTDSATFALLGIAYNAADDINESLSAFKKAYQLTPNAKNAYNLALQYEKIGSANEALATAKNGLNHDPNHAGLKEIIQKAAKSSSQSPASAVPKPAYSPPPLSPGPQCPSCGAPMSKNEMMCQMCGRNFNAPSQSAPPAGFDELSAQPNFFQPSQYPPYPQPPAGSFPSQPPQGYNPDWDAMMTAQMQEEQRRRKAGVYRGWSIGITIAGLFCFPIIGTIIALILAIIALKNGDKVGGTVLIIVNVIILIVTMVVLSAMFGIIMEFIKEFQNIDKYPGLGPDGAPAPNINPDLPPDIRP